MATEVIIRVSVGGDNTAAPTKEEFDRAQVRYLWAAAGGAPVHGGAFRDVLTAALGGIGTDVPARGL